MTSIAILRMLRSPAEQTFPREPKIIIGEDVVEMHVEYPSVLMQDIILANRQYVEQGKLFVSSSWLQHKYSSEEWAAAQVLALRSRKTYRYCLEQLGAVFTSAMPKSGLFGDEGPSIELSKKIVHQSRSFATFTGEELWAKSFLHDLTAAGVRGIDVVRLETRGDSMSYAYMNVAHKCHLSKRLEFADSLMTPETNMDADGFYVAGNVPLGPLMITNSSIPSGVDLFSSLERHSGYEGYFRPLSYLFVTRRLFDIIKMHGADGLFHVEIPMLV